MMMYREAQTTESVSWYISHCFLSICGRVMAHILARRSRGKINKVFRWTTAKETDNNVKDGVSATK